jgi:hypothetical protein
MLSTYLQQVLSNHIPGNLKGNRDDLHPEILEVSE